MYIDDVTASARHFFCFSLSILSHHDVMREGKKKQKREIERDAYYKRPTRHTIYPFVCLSARAWDEGSTAKLSMEALNFVNKY